jgi:stearoyl-CoA desaturase (Delta-9 desaturase)
MPTTPDASVEPATHTPRQDQQDRQRGQRQRPAEQPARPRTARPDVEAKKTSWPAQVALALFIAIPLLAVLAALPLAWGWGLDWHDVVIGLVFYVVSGLGVTVGYHRYFTHSSFKARKPLRIALAIAGSMAIEGPVITWVSDHRRHHKYSDKEGDPHSPWRYGSGWKALLKGLCYAHVGWLFDPDKTSQEKFCPDLLADSAIRKTDDWYVAWLAFSMLGPALIGGLWAMSPRAALTAFFWASLVRVALLHHVTWSINSICHVWGKEEFLARDKSRNVRWLAIPSFGESWHNLHHADPTCARHGALRGQVDSSARLIWAFERLGWAWDVRWPDEERLAARRPATATRGIGSMTKQNAAARGTEEKSIKAARQADKRAA